VKFEIICDDLKMGEKLMNDFSRIAEEEYSKNIKKTLKRVEILRKIGIVRPDFFIPEEVIFLVEREEDRIIISNSLPTPILMKIGKRPIKKMEENIRKFLESNGVKVFEVRYVGD